jgi:hypothetical protein
MLLRRRIALNKNQSTKSYRKQRAFLPCTVRILAMNNPAFNRGLDQNQTGSRKEIAVGQMAVMVTGLGGPAGYGENIFSTSTKTTGNNDDGSIQVNLTSVFGAGGLDYFGTSYP